MVDAQKLKRPTLVEEDAYLRFIAKCRKEHVSVKDTLERFMYQYIKAGEKLFADFVEKTK